MFWKKSKAEQLIDAARNGDTETVKSLIDKGADIEAKSKEGNNALIAAAVLGHTETVALLIDKGADIEATNNDGWTVLMNAASINMTETVELLIDKGVDINAATENGWTALMYAAGSGSTQVVKLLLDKGANIEAKDNEGQNALTWAENNGHNDAAEYIKKYAAGQRSKDSTVKKKSKEPRKVETDDDIDARDVEGKTALIRASTERDTEEIESLLKQGADIEATDDKGYTALGHAAKDGHNDAVELLLKQGANIEAQDNEGMTPLMHAICNGQQEAIELLLEKGADIETKDNEGQNALAWAKIANREIVEYLEEYATKHSVINAMLSGNVLSGLVGAASSGSLDEVKRLIKEGDVDLDERQGDDEYTAVHYAAWDGREEMLEILLKAGANPDLVGSDGYSPLIFAACNGRTGCVKILLDATVDTERRKNDEWYDTSDGGTALRGALWQQNWDIVDLLIGRGADIAHLAEPCQSSPDGVKISLFQAIKLYSKDKELHPDEEYQAKYDENKLNMLESKVYSSLNGENPIKIGEEEASIAGNLNSGRWPLLQGELLERFINGNSTSVKKVPDLSLWSEGVFKGSGVQDCAGKILSMMFMTMKEKEAHAFFNDLMKHLDKQRGGKTKEEKTKIDLYYPITREWLELAYKTRKAFSKIVNKFYDKYSIDDVVDCASIDQEEQVNAMGFDYSQKEDETDIFIIMRDPKTDGKEMFEISLTKSNKGLKLSALCRNTIYLISSDNDEIREYMPDENEQPKGHLNSSESGDASHQQEDEAPAKGKKIKYASWPEFEEKESAREPLRKSFMPIAKNAHELIISTFKENKMAVEVRYGGGTFSFSVPQDLAKSRTRTCLRFGLLNFKMDSSYIESLYKDATDKLPDGAKQRKKDDPTEYFYNFASLDDFEKVKKDLKEGIVRSYKILAK